MRLITNKNKQTIPKKKKKKKKSLNALEKVKSMRHKSF